MGEKRRRDQKGPGPQQQQKKKKSTPNAAGVDSDWDGFVGLNDLNWKEVSLPDRIDDVEGFYGLEEIDGVDIVRPEGSGEIKFKVCLAMLFYLRVADTLRWPPGNGRTRSSRANPQKKSLSMTSGLGLAMMSLRKKPPQKTRRLRKRRLRKSRARNPR